MVLATNKALDGAPGAVKVAALEYLTADLRLLAVLEYLLDAYMQR